MESKKSSDKTYFIIVNLEKQTTAIVRSKKQVMGLLKISIYTLNKALNVDGGVYKNYLISIPKLVILKKDSGGKR